MTEPRLTNLENRLIEAARDFRYPATPDIAGAVGRRLAKSRRAAPRLPRKRLIASVVALALLVAIPPVRSAMVEWLRLGVVWVAQIGDTDVDRSQPAPERFLAMAAESVSLAEAVRRAPFDVLIPTWPRSAKEPSEVFLQQRNGQANVFMVWHDGEGHAVQALYQLGADGLTKGGVVVSSTWLDGVEALWVEGPHMLHIEGDHYQPWYFVEGNVLLWSNDGLTYRLETRASLEEAVRIGESLEPARNVFPE